MNGVVFFGHDYDQTKEWESLGWVTDIAQIKGL
jgi:hypothetical protein